MPRKAKPIVLPDEDRELLEKLQPGQKTEKRLAFRASIILACSSGKMFRDIASELHTRSNTVIQWRDRYLGNGIRGLYAETRTGKPKKHQADLKVQIVNLIGKDPPHGHAIWNCPLIAEELGVSNDTVWKILRDDGIRLQSHRSWFISVAPEFTTKS